MPHDPNEVAAIADEERELRREADDRCKHAEQRSVEAEGRAAARAPRRLRLNVTRGTEESPGYVICSVFQSDNGVNWACAGTDVTFGADWFRAVFGGGEEIEAGLRLEFDIVNAHTVTD